MTVDRRQDTDSRDRIDALHNFVKTARRVLLILFIVQLVLGLLDVKLLNDNSSRIADIQQSRLALCRETNNRHNGTVHKLNEEISQLPANERRQAEANKQFTIALIDQLAPVRNCVAALR